MRETSNPSTAIFRGICAFAVFLAVFACAPCRAEGGAVTGPVRDLGVTEVTGGGPDAAAPDSSEFTSYAEILPGAWEGRGLSASQVLAALPGVQHYRQGGLGSFQTVSVRGIAARSVIVCVDGVPLNDAGGGAVDLGTIDLNQVERIEVYKDRVPARFGGSGIGGAVNFVTRGARAAGAGGADGAAGAGRLLASFGSHGSWEAALSMTARPGDSVTVAASISARHSDNDYEFENRNGTLYNEDDDFTDRRRNAEFTEVGALLKARVLHGNGVFSTVSASVGSSAGGNPGREDVQTVTAGFEGLNSQVGYRAELPQFFGWLWLELGIAGRFEKNMAHSYYPLDHIGYESTEYLEYGTAGYRLIPEVVASYAGSRLEAGLRFAGGLDYYGARGSSRGWNLSRISANVSGEAEFRALRWLAVGAEGSTLFTKDDIHGGTFVLPTASSRLASAKTSGFQWGGRGFVRLGNVTGANGAGAYSTGANPSGAGLPASKNPAAHGKIAYGASASLGRLYREPQLMELYGVYPGMVSNPDLREETAVRWEAGAFVTTPGGVSTLRATYFETLSENGIYWVVSGAFMKPMNVGEALARGIEAELSSTPAKFLDVILRATFQKTEDRSEDAAYRGHRLPYEPARSYFAEATLRLPFKLDFTWTSEFRSEISSDRGGRITQPASDFHSAALGWNAREKTRLAFAVQNITDETYRNIYSPYPMPGREYKFTFTQGF